MRTFLCAVVGGMLCMAGAALPAHAAIRGEYVEARSADIYTGPCFANSQVDLQGKQAIMGWKVTEGDWQGVKLDGLSVVAVVKARTTLGDPYREPYPAESILIVDQRADVSQRAALEALAKSMAGRLLDHVVSVARAPIRMEVGQGAAQGSATLVAGDLAKIQTRRLCAADMICGNEVVYYPPLVRAVHAMPAYSSEDAFHGRGLGVDWTRLGARSAFVGSFAM
jgi:Protein of unknown function (DUF1326)